MKALKQIKPEVAQFLDNFTYPSTGKGKDKAHRILAKKSNAHANAEQQFKITDTDQQSENTDQKSEKTDEDEEKDDLLSHSILDPPNADEKDDASTSEYHILYLRSLLMVLNFLGKGQNPATRRLLQSMDTITAWLVSSRSLANQAHQLLGKNLKVNYFYCPEVPLAKCDQTMVAKLDQLFPTLALE